MHVTNGSTLHVGGLLSADCQYKKLSWVRPACREVGRNAILEGTQISQRQALPKADGNRKPHFGDAGFNDLLKDTEGKDVRSTGKEEGVLAPAARERPTSSGLAERIAPEAMETSENVRAGDDKMDILSQELTSAPGLILRP